ncbi:MAG TPA: deoxyribodipyrimidine photo-lyase [Chthoniobacteraceae bacterium]|nr:deoxyribodipyrimidine photo-lyase [Chthoniobacteraceae bacterium]
MPVIHWFRRDLRIMDNTALAAACKNEAVVPVYIASGWRESHRWTGAPRMEFLCGCLESLAKNIEAIGGRLIFRRGRADEELEKLARETKATAIYFNRDPDPFGRAMEERVAKMATRLGIEVHSFKDAAIHERDEILTSTGGPYRVFTPYSRAWMQAEKPPVQRAVRKLATPRGTRSLHMPTLADWGLESAASIPATGEKAARKRLDDFLHGPLLSYGANRDLPAGRHTSCLSADLRHGTISVREIHSRCVLLAREAHADRRKSIFTFINELVWREFYMQILWHFPAVLEHEFNPKWRNLKWRKPGADFRRWCEGATGFPIVDAGMRQLNATGFMHNRLRMITAMFLTKDLHIDWRHGERYFMQRLIDGEIASNNGGWQWSAGTGADAAPYFRIQNPWTQTARYDPEGQYIKQWLPGLRDVDPAKFTRAPAEGEHLAKDYPPPMVDHAKERDVTLEMFSEG